MSFNLTSHEDIGCNYLILYLSPRKTMTAVSASLLDLIHLGHHSYLFPDLDERKDDREGNLRPSDFRDCSW